MTDVDARVREAFATVTLPETLNERTLAAIESHRTKLDEAPLPPVRKTLRRRRGMLAASLAAAACFVIALVGVTFVMSNDETPSGNGIPGGSIVAVNEPTAFITLDVNPSIEIALDDNDVVLSLRGLNDDGKDTLSALEAEGANFVGLPADEALDLLAESAAFSSYLTEKAYVALSVICANENQRLRILQAGENYLTTLPCQGSCDIASSEEHQAAAEAGMGVQRFRAAQTLLELDPSFTWDDCRNMSMRELRDCLARLDVELSDIASTGNGGGAGSGNGNGGGSGNHGGNGSGNGNNAGFGSDNGNGRHQQAHGIAA